MCIRDRLSALSGSLPENQEFHHCTVWSFTKKSKSLKHSLVLYQGKDLPFKTLIVLYNLKRPVSRLPDVRFSLFQSLNSCIFHQLQLCFSSRPPQSVRWFRKSSPDLGIDCPFKQKWLPFTISKLTHTCGDLEHLSRHLKVLLCP